MYTSLLLVAALSSGYYQSPTIVPGSVTISGTVISSPVITQPVTYASPTQTYVTRGRRGRVVRSAPVYTASPTIVSSGTITSSPVYIGSAPSITSPTIVIGSAAPAVTSSPIITTGSAPVYFGGRSYSFGGGGCASCR